MACARAPANWRAEYAPCIARLVWKTGWAATMVEKCLTGLREIGALLSLPRQESGAPPVLRIERIELAALPKQGP